MEIDQAVQALRQNLNAVNQDRSYIDKILSQEEIKELAGELLSKKIYTRADCNKLQFLLNGKELKLTNLQENQRYVHNKYYCWIEEALALYVIYLDYFESEKQDMNTETIKLYQDTLSVMTSVCKQMSYLYFHLTRSALSLNGWGMSKIMDSHVEYEYTQKLQQATVEPERKKFLGMI